jgi:hypothetical protein
MTRARVDLDRLLADAEHRADLLVRHAGHHTGEHLDLARGQHADAPLDLHAAGRGDGDAYLLRR